MRNNGSHNRPREAHVTSLSLRRRCPLTGDQSVPPNPPGEPCHYHAGPHRADRPDLRALMKFPTCCRPAIGYPTFTYLHGRGRDGRKPFTPLASNASSRFDRIFRPLFRNEACRGVAAAASQMARTTASKVDSGKHAPILARESPPYRSYGNSSGQL